MLILYNKTAAFSILFSNLLKLLTEISQYYIIIQNVMGREFNKKLKYPRILLFILR